MTESILLVILVALVVVGAALICPLAGLLSYGAM